MSQVAPMVIQNRMLFPGFYPALRIHNKEYLRYNYLVIHGALLFRGAATV